MKVAGSKDWIKAIFKGNAICRKLHTKKVGKLPREVSQKRTGDWPVVRNRHGEMAGCMQRGTSTEQTATEFMHLLSRDVILCADEIPAASRSPEKQKSFIAPSILPHANELSAIFIILIMA